MQKDNPFKKHLLCILVCAAMLALFGLISIYSASYIYALEQQGNAYYYLIKQSVGLLIALFLLLFIAHIPLGYIYSYALLAFVCSLCCAATPLLFPFLSRTVHGSTRWLTLFGLTFQPTELCKITFIPAIAYLMSRTSAYTSYHSLYTTVTALCATAPLICILLMQPDFGQTVLFIIVLCFIISLHAANLKMFFGLCSVAGVGAALLIVTAPYRLRRLLIFLNPWQDAQGSGFQVIQSLIAIGSGGWFGLGLGKSHQKFFYLPMQHTDFIFSIIAEEIGFIGCTLLLSLYTLILYSGIKITLNAQGHFSRLLIVGSISMLSTQTVINLAVATGLVPTKGIGLPFISYGLSALIAQGALLGLITAAVKAESTLLRRTFPPTSSTL